MVVSKIGFIIFYTAFLVFVVYISGQAGATILGNVPEFSAMPDPNILDVFVTLQWFFALLLVSTEYQILFTLVLTPMIVAMGWTILEFIRG